jgi:hypothetical protein
MNAHSLAPDKKWAFLKKDVQNRFGRKGSAMGNVVQQTMSSKDACINALRLPSTMRNHTCLQRMLSYFLLKSWTFFTKEPPGEMTYR